MRSDRPQNPEYPRGFRNVGDLHSVVIPIPLTLLLPSFSLPRDRDDQDKCGRLVGSTHARFSGLSKGEREIGGMGERGKEREKKESFSGWGVMRARVCDGFSYLWKANWTKSEKSIPSPVPFLRRSYIVHQIPRLWRNLQISYQCHNVLRASLIYSRSTCIRFGHELYRKERIGQT